MQLIVLYLKCVRDLIQLVVYCVCLAAKGSVWLTLYRE